MSLIPIKEKKIHFISDEEIKSKDENFLNYYLQYMRDKKTEFSRSICLNDVNSYVLSTCDFIIVEKEVYKVENELRKRRGQRVMIDQSIENSMRRLFQLAGTPKFCSKMP